MKITQLILLSLIIINVFCVKSKAKQDDEPLIHDNIKLALWLVFGVIVGVFFEAKIQLQEIVKPITEKGITGLAIAVSIYALFKFASLASNYL
jgi:xanthine/uracil permease